MKLKDVYISAMNAVTPLGFSVEENLRSLDNGESGITKQHPKIPGREPYYAAVVDSDKLNSAFNSLNFTGTFTKLEMMMALALKPVVDAAGQKIGTTTGFILSTTKGNISSIKNGSSDDAMLHSLASKMCSIFNIPAEPVVVSNACVSGVLAVSVAKRLIQAGMYENVIVVAGDEVSDFVVSGFQSFQAMSPEPCKPYSANRSGVSLGEAAAAVFVTSTPDNALAKIAGDGSINDANHISGPSRTGEGLFRSIKSAVEEARIKYSDIDYISAHGTATPFNDEMEAIAFNRHDLAEVPVNSLKGYYGHTLGASGLLETVIAVASMKNSKVYASHGFDSPGVSQPLNIISRNAEIQMNHILKTASGFGGCNTAVILEKVN